MFAQSDMSRNTIQYNGLQVICEVLSRRRATRHSPCSHSARTRVHLRVRRSYIRSRPGGAADGIHSRFHDRGLGGRWGGVASAAGRAGRQGGLRRLPRGGGGAVRPVGPLGAGAQGREQPVRRVRGLPRQRREARRSRRRRRHDSFVQEPLERRRGAGLPELPPEGARDGMGRQPAPDGGRLLPRLPHDPPVAEGDGPADRRRGHGGGARHGARGERARSPSRRSSSAWAATSRSGRSSCSSRGTRSARAG